MVTTSSTMTMSTTTTTTMTITMTMHKACSKAFRQELDIDMQKVPFTASANYKKYTTGNMNHAFQCKWRKHGLAVWNGAGVEKVMTPQAFKWDRRKIPYRSGSISKIFKIQASIDDEFRSPRNIALGLHRRYRQVVDRGFSNNMKEFITAAVTAYAVGCTEEGLRRELLSIKDSNEDFNFKSTKSISSGLKSRLSTEEIEECILWLSIVFITILCTPQPTIVRWSNTSPVSAEAQLEWGGFCALIANAYYTRGMAWLPVKTLQMEQMAVMGRADEPSLVADRMRLVFATLENVSPQWPKG